MKNLTMLAIALLFSACNTTKNTMVQPENNLSENPNPARDYFQGGSTEPVWNVKISQDRILFTSVTKGFESLEFPYTEPIMAMDAHVKRYRSSNGKQEIDLTYTMTHCTQKSDGKEFPFEVRAQITEGKKSLDFTGCGDYVMDLRLHDIFALESINGKKVSVDEFAREIPSMEINTYEKRVSGYAGCNRMMGSVSQMGVNHLRFLQIASTKMFCHGKNREEEFLKNLSMVTRYSFGDNRLKLYSDDKEVLVFKKVD